MDLDPGEETGRLAQDTGQPAQRLRPQSVGEAIGDQMACRPE